MACWFALSWCLIVLIFWFFGSVVLLVTIWLVFMVRFLFVACLVALLMVGRGYGFVYG